MRRAAILAVLAAVAGLVTAAGLEPSASAGVSPGVTELVSVDDAGEPADEISFGARVSGNGRYVVFMSDEQLDADVPDSEDYQVFVRDLVDGGTEQLSVYIEDEDDGPPVLRPADTDVLQPVISADGRFVAVRTSATMNGQFSGFSKILRIDRDPDADGQFDEPDADGLIDLSLLQVSPTPDGAGSIAAYDPSISDDGSRIAYQQYVNDGSGHIGVTTVTENLGGAPTLVHRALFPQQPSLELRQASSPEISGDGTRIVAVGNYDAPPPVIGIAPAAALPVPGQAVVVFEVPPPLEPTVATRVDVGANGLPVGEHLGGNQPMISDDGETVVFEASVPLDCGVGCEFPPYEARSYLTRVDPDGDGVPGPDVVTELLSLDTAGAEVRGIMPTISGNGRYAAFVTDEPNTHNGIDQPEGAFPCAEPRSPTLGLMASAAALQSPSHCQVVVRDLVNDARRAADGLPRLPGELASASVDDFCADVVGPEDTCAAAGYSSEPSISDDGGIVVFHSDADDLITADDNVEQDVFARRFTPGMEIEPVDFGGVQLGEEATATTTVTPVGFGPLVIESVELDGPAGGDFELGPHTCGVPLHQGDSCAVAVDFTPATEGTRTGTLTLTPRRAAPVNVPVSGVGTPFPQQDPVFAMSPDVLDFGERLTLSDSAPAAVTVRNDGEATMFVAGVGLPALPAPAAPADYRIGTDGCTGVALTAGASCTVTVVHRPLAPGDRPAVLQIDQLVPTGTQPHLVQLRGRGTTPTAQVNPGVVAVGRLTSVLGAGFPPAQDVRITMPGYPELVVARTDDAGRFVATFVVYPNSVPGSRVVDASVAGPAGPIGDTENLLVVPGTMGPPDFLARR